ncbi:MAG: d-isomer specific 2-hydroxyacid dehydrogenase nad-binding protein [Parcubacteria group bacterium Gr01-1014_72]|nr:MAG: d-isomer specific 2-hydroxyacid dehydrogenase nad-binding protein [Parcubacteria group bacterium Gr01-1014_72]
MTKIFVTRKIPDLGITMLREKGFEVDVSSKNRPLTKRELIKFLQKKSYDGVLSLLTDPIDAEVMDAASTVKIYANYAIGFNNIDITEAKKRGIIVTNTPGGGADRVAEHAFALILALSCRVVEGDNFMRKGKYKGWDPMIFHGTKIAGKTLGIIGTGRIGADIAKRAARGFEMKVVYYDVVRNEALERDFGAVFLATPEEVLKQSDVVSLHVPLTKETTHLINRERLALMKKTAFLINTSRGPVVDETALVAALKAGTIAGAGLDVFEREPKLAKGLAKLPNVVLTPHIASATAEARHDMARLAAGNLIAFFEGRAVPNKVS